MEVGIVKQVDIDQQMQEAYLDYAMSVIVSRALPDVRDGLKPVHRRILYAMHDMGVRAGLPHKKSARIVGEVLGKYHPHGDATVYDSMVRMAQDFTMRIPLVDGQGNFGSVDGDPAAAMRYTEARLAHMATEVMADIERDTVDFTENFDGSLSEPSVLPTKMPNFLVNGGSGIAVGMATSIPPHNLNEVCDALILMIDRAGSKEEVTVDELLEFVQGPDFPTGGIVYRYRSKKGKSDEVNDMLRSAYALGRGRVTVQAKVHIEEMSRNRHRLVVTELPYQTNKANLVEKIADLARDGKLEGLADLRDESDRQGMRLVLELTRTTKPRAMLKRLFKMTTMSGTFSINMLGLVDGEPRLLPLKRSLQLFIKHRMTIISRRSKFELDKAKDRAHILEGLRIALDDLDAVIDTIRRSRTVETARKNLTKKFKLSQAQAQAILDMPLRRLAALERKKIETEYKELLKRIKHLEGLLKSKKKILAVIKSELEGLKEKYGTSRRTLIVDETDDADVVTTARDLVPAEDMVVAITESGRFCAWPAEENLGPSRGYQKDPLTTALLANTRDQLYLFTANGQALIIPMHQVPKGRDPSEGPSLLEFFTSFSPEAPVVAGLALPHLEKHNGYLFLASAQGRVKRITLQDISEIRGDNATIMGIESGDSLLTVFTTPGEGEVVLTASNGQGIRFAEEEVRAMGLTAAGVWGIKLGDNDRLVGGGPVVQWGELVVVSETGVGKRIDLDQFSRQGRYGQGVVAMPMGDEDSSPLAAASVINLSNRVMFVSEKKNTKTVYGRSLPKASRTSKGKSLMSIRGRDGIRRIIVLGT